jgi:hypothetical protein
VNTTARTMEARAKRAVVPMECEVAIGAKIKKAAVSCGLWEMRGSNPRPPRCKRGALNQLS